jgi:hypothetical protein
MPGVLAVNDGAQPLFTTTRRNPSALPATRVRKGGW